MAFIEYNNVGITGMAACVPKNISRNAGLSDVVSAEDLYKVINNIGIKEKRFVDKGVTASDLCFVAAEKLLTDMEIKRNSIDMVIFLSQLPDFKMPATSPNLQHKLGLNSSTACFDMSLACSGYVYGLSAAFAFASQIGINRVLLLVGDTMSVSVNSKDKVSAPLFGDAGSATLIEKSTTGKSFFSLYSDGSGQDTIKIKAGGSRNPTSFSNLEIKLQPDGNYRSENQFYMNGLDVFNFSMRVVPTSIKAILLHSGKTSDDVDYFIFHQSNRFMIEFFLKKLKIPSEKVPFSLEKFGNTSSASIPLTIVTELRNDINDKKQFILMSGFGAGLSWGTAITNFENAYICDLVEY